MRLKPVSLFIASFLLLASLAMAQSQTSGWAGYVTSFQSDKSHWGFVFDGQLRSSDQFEYLQQFVLRPGVSYKLNDKFTGAVGYAYVSNRVVIDGETDRIDEHRAWEQMIFKHKIGRVSMSHRLRVEQRWISTLAAPDDYQAQQRFRYFLRGVIPFTNQEKFTKGFYAAVQDEVMFNYVNKEVTNNSFFDQNRAYAGLGYRFNSKFDLETGYMNQLVMQRNGGSFTNNIIQLSFYSRFGF